MAIARTKVLLGYQITREKYTHDTTTGKNTPVSGEHVVVKSNVIIDLPQSVGTYFDIVGYSGQSTTTNTNSTSMDVSTIKAHTAQVYKGLDATGSVINVGTGYRLNGGGKAQRVFKKSVRIPTLLKNASGSIRYVTIGFPSFFNNIMISQALGSMLQAAGSKQPGYFLTKAGARYPITYNTATAPLNNSANIALPHGAWVETSPQAEQNTNNPGDSIPSGTIEGESQGGSRKARG